MLESILRAEEIKPLESADSAGFKFPWSLFVTIFVPIVLCSIIDYLWWNHNVKGLRHIPTSKCNRHIFMAYRVLKSMFKNKKTEPNVCKYS